MTTTTTYKQRRKERLGPLAAIEDRKACGPGNNYHDGVSVVGNDSTKDARQPVELEVGTTIDTR